MAVGDTVDPPTTVGWDLELLVAYQHNSTMLMVPCTSEVESKHRQTHAATRPMGIVANDCVYNWARLAVAMRRYSCCFSTPCTHDHKRAYNDPPRTRTWNLRLRRPTPYPLGQQADAFYVALPWPRRDHSHHGVKCCAVRGQYRQTNR